MRVRKPSCVVLEDCGLLVRSLGELELEGRGIP